MNNTTKGFSLGNYRQSFCIILGFLLNNVNQNTFKLKKHLVFYYINNTIHININEINLLNLRMDITKYRIPFI